MKAALSVLTVLLSACATAAGPAAPGLFVFGHEVQTFQPCHSAQVFWVTGAEPQLRPLRALAEKKRLAAGKPYAPIYAELDGRVDRESKRDGFAADYDGLFRLTSVQMASLDVPPSCPGPRR